MSSLRQAARVGADLFGRAMDDLLPSDDTPPRDAWEADTPEQYCHRCGASTGPGAKTSAGCAFCLNAPIAWHKIVRLKAYHDPMDQWILSLKFRQGWWWGPWFGRQLAPRMQPHAADRRVIVCPVPMHWMRRWSRGYNQADLIARSLAKHAGVQHTDLLVRRRNTAPQTHVPASQRSKNVQDAIAMKNIDLTGWDVWLVDDVKTTGSTLTACARELRKHGANRVTVAVAAVADPKGLNFTRV